MLDTREKAEIIFEFINDYRSDEAFEDFFSYNDLGVPLAVMIVNDLVILNEGGVQVLDETWESLCENLNDADVEYDYESLNELIEKAVPFEDGIDLEEE
jgi:hypothetical protein